MKDKLGRVVIPAVKVILNLSHKSRMQETRQIVNGVSPDSPIIKEKSGEPSSHSVGVSERQEQQFYVL